MAAAPKADRPHMPGYGIVPADQGELLSWGWAEERLTGSHNYWISTVRADGRPHCMGVWGVWSEGEFWFSSGAESLKTRNLLKNAYCVICTEKASEPVVLEGTARQEALPSTSAAALYKDKYKYDLDPATGPIFAVTPKVAFGLVEYEMTKTATRWSF
jgi:hypothetical protein